MFVAQGRGACIYDTSATLIQVQFIPVPSIGSVFTLEMTPVEKLISVRWVILVRVESGGCAGWRFLFRYESFYRYRVDAV